MKKMIMLTVMTLAFGVSELEAQTWVNGYTKSNGTTVQGHYRSNSDGVFSNNWSTKGNTNPYTGSKGYKTSPSYNYSTPSYNYNSNSRRSSGSSYSIWD
tara:strand:+ start:144 stop:440 length:297 start_codon:yes stop_codon:yes gene_type:complete